MVTLEPVADDWAATGRAAATAREARVKREVQRILNGFLEMKDGTTPARPGGMRKRRRGLPRQRWLEGARRAGGLQRLGGRSEEHTSELQSQSNLVCRLLLEKKKKNKS